MLSSWAFLGGKKSTQPPVKAFSCFGCKRTFVNQGSVTKHLLGNPTHDHTKKTENRPFQCEDCKYCFKSNQDLARHILKDHVPTAKGVTNAPVIVPPPPGMEFKTSLPPVMPPSLPRRGPGGGVSKSSYVCSDYEKGLKGAAAVQAFENAPDALQDLTLNAWCKQRPYNDSKISLSRSL